jgi:hypothetical protein
MFFIAHRGNCYGKREDRENTFRHISNALHQTFQVEVDIWYAGYNFYLGHDAPTQKVISTNTLLMNDKVWFHAKTIETLHQLLNHQVKHCFYIGLDERIALTSSGYIWTSPGGPLTSKSIAVMPEEADWEVEELMGAAGICSDDPMDWLLKFGDFVDEQYR